MLVTELWLISFVMTCRHYRFQIPREEADELRAADPQPCPVCDRRPKRNFQTVSWSPRLITPISSQPIYEKLQGWIVHLFQRHPVPAKRQPGAPASVVSSC